MAKDFYDIEFNWITVLKNFDVNYKAAVITDLLDSNNNKYKNRKGFEL